MTSVIYSLPVITGEKEIKINVIAVKKEICTCKIA